MENIDALFLGILQGITEFLPVSSSGHLVLGEEYLGLNVVDLKSFDVVVHMGTLLAIFVYFWKDIWAMICALGRFILGKIGTEDAYVKLIGFVIVGTVPAVFAGLFLEEWIDGIFRNVSYVAGAMFVMGFVFLLGEYVHKKAYEDLSFGEFLGKFFEKIHKFFKGEMEHEEIKGMRWWKALVIGFAQALALIPGVSRSGSTIVAGLFQGIDRESAARFSFLLGIPAMAGAGLLTGMKAYETGEIGVALMPLFVGFFSSFVFGLLSVYFLMKFLKTNRLTIFAVYLILLGGSMFI